jgi:hypothetical protein
VAEKSSRKPSYFAALSPEDRALFVADLTNKKLGVVAIANKWSATHGPINKSQIHRYRQKPEFAIALGNAANRVSLAKAFDTAVRRGVEPALGKVQSRAEEIYELAKMEPKRNYKALTDALGIMLEIAKLDPEVYERTGGASRQESQGNGQTTLNLSQMIVLPRTGPLQVERTPEQALLEDPDVMEAEWMPVEEDMRLLEDDDGEE